MTLIYLTADKVGLASGGGKVTFEESEALKSIGPCEVWDRDWIGGNGSPDPWGWDSKFYSYLLTDYKYEWPRLAHVYAGTFTGSVEWLQHNGTKVTYTAAAHDIDVSRREHETLGLPFNYPHLTDPGLWERYVGGYRAADAVICPSEHSAACMRRYGCQNVVVIPHGVDLPARTTKAREDSFVVGYLGAVGPDKGLRVLLAAWKELGYPLAEGMLTIAGQYSNSHFMRELCRANGLVPVETEPSDLTSTWSTKDKRSYVYLTGWMENVTFFYELLSLYVQPSMSEGFGIEVLEAMAHARPVVCSTGAGAVDCVGKQWRFPAGDVRALANLIDDAKRDREARDEAAAWNRYEAEKRYQWADIRKKYQELWRSLL